MSCSGCEKDCSTCNVEVRQKYINAVLNIDVEGLEHLLDTEPFDHSLLDRLLPPCPKGCSILWLIQCWEIILAEEHQGEYGEIVAKRRKQNAKIKHLFIEKIHANFIPINFQISPFIFYRSDLDETVEDIFSLTREQLNAKGIRNIDIDLFCAVCKFQFKEVKKLLRAGANPNAPVDIYGIDEDEEGQTCLNRIGIEYDYLEFASLNKLISGEEYVTSDYYRYFTDLIGLAAHKKMYSMLLKYNRY